MTFSENMHCEEFYKEPVLNIPETTTIITPNLLIVAQHINGQLISSLGTKVKAEPIELNHIKVEKNGELRFYELGSNVKWVEEADELNEVLGVRDRQEDK